MTLQFFSKKPEAEDGKRYRAVTTVQTWLWRKDYLPKDLRAALLHLIPELDRGGHDEQRQDQPDYD